MSCLTIVQNVCGRLRIAKPAAVWSSTDVQIIQMRDLLNEQLIDLKNFPDNTWQALTIETSFSTAATNDQGPIPGDLNYIIPMSMWNRTMNRQIWGPMDEQQWQQELAGPTFTSPYYAMRLRGNHILLTPVPAAGNSVFYEYITNNCVYGGGGSTLNQTAFAADADTPAFPENLMELGLRWMFLRANGFDYAQEYDAWMTLLLSTSARNKSAQRLSASERYPWNRRTPFIPLGNWNV
jgi:hypothetical protein